MEVVKGERAGGPEATPVYSRIQAAGAPSSRSGQGGGPGSAGIPGTSDASRQVAAVTSPVRRRGVCREWAAVSSRGEDSGVGTDGRAADNGERLVKKSLATARRESGAPPQEWRARMSQLITEAGQDARPLSVARRCQVLSLSRATYYRTRQRDRPVLRDMELRDQLQRLVLQWPMYGYRRLTHALRRQGVLVNHKRVLRLLREDSLLCLRPRRGVRTTNSHHGLPTYPNLVPTVRLNGLNQLWVADLTYIRLAREFVYLAVVLDAYSRRCIGWALDRTLEATLAVTALNQALATRPVGLGLIHHSDQGVQYASTAYTDRLKSHQIRISMGRRGRPQDDAQAESFLKTLKYEEVYLGEYEDLADARVRLGHFPEDVYNRKRLHSALGYRPPAEFEQGLRPTTRASPVVSSPGGTPR